MVWKNKNFFWQETNSHQQNSIGMAFTAVDDPDKLGEIETETGCHQTAAMQMCTLACYNSPATNCCKNSKYDERGAKSRRFNRLQRTAADASPTFCLTGNFAQFSFLLWLTWADPPPAILLWATGFECVQFGAATANQKQPLHQQALCGSACFLPFCNSHHATTAVTWGK